MFLNGTRVGKIYFGGTQVAAAYFNGQKVWPKVTQAMIDAYTSAVRDQRTAQLIIDHYPNPWHGAHDKFRDAMRHLEDHSSWGYPWDTFFNTWDTNQIKDYIYDAGNRLPGAFGGNSLSFYSDPATRIVDIVAQFILFGITNVNPDQSIKTRWEERRIAYYIVANQANSPPPYPADAVAQWELLRAHVNDLSAIPAGFQGAGADLIEVAKLVWSLTHISTLNAAVTAAAKIITDLGGDLPTVP
jgi:hypothetical protein